MKRPRTKDNAVLVGVDVGTTVVKAAAFEVERGTCLAAAGCRMKVVSRPDGRREQSAVALDRALGRVLGTLRESLGSRWGTVAGLGLAAQGGSTIIADRRTGKPLTPMMLWNDTRALKELSEIREETGPRFWRRHTLRDEPAWGLARLRWLRKRRPRLLNPARNIAVGAGEFCMFRFTEKWRQDGGSALQMGCYNAVGQDLDPELTDYAGLPVEFFAPMRRGHESHPLCPKAAKRLGLEAGIPVAGPYMDHEAGMLSATGGGDAPLQCSLGTAWVGNVELPDGMEWSSPLQLVVPAVAGKGSLVIQPLLTGNIAWDRGLALFVDPDHGKALNKVNRLFKQDPLPPEGLVALPWFNFPNPRCDTAVGAGTFYGMNLNTSPVDLLKALAVSLTCEMARVFNDVLSRDLVDGVVLGGGASKAWYFGAMLATLFESASVSRIVEEDLAGTRGVLAGFDSRVARAGTERVKRPGKRFRDRVLAGRDLYMDIFDRLCGDVAAARPLVFK